MAQLKTRIILRNDSTANWLANKTTVLLKGEVGVEFNPEAAAIGGKVKIKIGDGTHTWEELPYFSGNGNYEVTANPGETKEDAVTRITKGKELAEGDTVIVKVLIADGQYSYTAYVYNGTAWAAMDGNYNAKNVIFDSDLTFTEPIGTVTIPSSGSKVYPAAGKSLFDILSGIIAEEDKTGLKKADPSLSISTSIKYAEVGQTVTPSYVTSFYKGDYKYAPDDTGVTASNYVITNNLTSETKSTASGSFAPYTFKKVEKFTVNAKCDHSAGATPQSNIGNEFPEQAIKEKKGLAAAGKTVYSSYLPNFYGYVNSIEGKVALTAEGLTSAFIRGLQNNQKQTETPVNSYDIPEKWAQFFYALPAGRKNNLTAKDGNNITCTVTKIASCSVAHPGAENTLYDVFAIDNAALYGATKLQLSWS